MYQVLRYNSFAMSELVTLTLKLPRNTEVTPEATKTFLAALTQINPIGGLEKIFGKKQESLCE